MNTSISPILIKMRIATFLLFFVLSFSWISAQDLCRSDTSFTDIIFLIDNSQSIDDAEFQEFTNIITATIQKVKSSCEDSQLGVVHYGGAFGLETNISYPLSKNNTINNIERRFCTSRNSSGFCSEGGGDDLNNAIGDIIAGINNGDLNRNPMNSLELVIFTDAFGFDANCSFINCSVIRPFTNIDILKSSFGANVTVVGASAQAEASLLAIYASPGGEFDNVQLFEDCSSTFDGCVTPRKYIPVNFDSPVESTSDSIASFVECRINVIQVVNPNLGINRSVCGDLGESATLTVNLPEGESALMYSWSNGLPSTPSVTVTPSVTTTYSVTVTDQNGCTGSDMVTVFVESCAPDCSPDTSYADIIFLIDNSQSIDDAEFEEFTNIITTAIQKVQAKCQNSQIGLAHYGGAFGSETDIQFDLSTDNTITTVERRYCTTRNSSGFCSEGGGDDLNNAIGDIITALNDGTLNRNPTNKLRLVIFTDAFGFDASCSFINCSVIRPFTNIDILKQNFDAQVTVVGASAQAEASLLAIYASPGGNFNNVQLFEDCSSSFDGCQTPRKYIPIEFDSPISAATDSIVACIDCDIQILPGFVIDLGPSQTICSDLDSSATITPQITNGVEPIQYSWDNGLPNQGSVTVRPAVTTTYTLSALDGIGCTTTASITVVVEDCVPDCMDAPIFTSCAPLFEGCPGGSTDPSITGMPVVLPGSPSCPTPILTYSDDTTTIMGCNMAISRTWTATYPADDQTTPNLISTCVQSIQLMDMTPPVITGLPVDITVDSDQSCTAAVTWNMPTATDNCGVRSIMSNIQSGNVFPVGSTAIIYTAIDDCGNISMATFNVIVIERCCTTPPTLTCPDAFTGCTSSSTDPSVTGSPIAVAGSANCPAPVVTFNDAPQAGSTACQNVILRTWTASYPGITDPGLTSTCVQTISLTDSENPVIDNVPANITMDSDQSCTAVVTWATPTATDNCGVASLVSNIMSGSSFDLGATTVTYTATDNCGNTSTSSFTVTIIENCCTRPPIITCPANFSACPGSVFDPSVTGIASAAAPGPECPTPSVSFSDNEIVSEDNCTVTIVRTWKAFYPGILDAALSAECIQFITLTDNENPTFSNVPQNITIDSDQSCTARVTWSAPTASDNCGIPSRTSNFNSGDTFDSGTTTVTYTATDLCGNTSTVSFTVTVIERCCKVPPILTCPSNFEGCPNDPIIPVESGQATAVRGSVDCPDPIVTFSDRTINDSTDCLTIIERTWTARYPGINDDALTSTCIQMITLQDVEPPLIPGMPSDMVVASDETCLARVTWEAPIAVDNCEISSITSDIAIGSIFEIGNTVVTYTAVDNCGNTTQASFTITVTKACCQELPSVIAPPDYEACIGTSTAPETTGFGLGVAGGQFCQDPIVTFMDMTVSEGPNGEVTIKRTWKATDPITDSLMVSSDQLIVLQDIEDPALAACPDDITLDPDNPIHTWETPAFTDNCEASISVNIESGSTFMTGVTTVTYTVVDIAGNTATCSFLVTVPEEVEIVCPDDMLLRCSEELVLADLPAPQIMTNCPECQEDNIVDFEYLGYRNGSSYYISDKADDWQEANVTAQAAGGTLVIINDAEENDFIKSLLPDNSAFIGLQDYDTEGEFVWSDGSPLTYSNWFDGQPNNYGNRQDYVEIMKNGQWNDQSNNKSLRYIIEVACVEITRSIENVEVMGENTTYTIRYVAVDRCGTDDECVFTVSTDNEAKLECPEDIVLNIPYGWSRVSWDDPVYNTCCAVCPRRDIKGYIYMGNLGDSYYYCSAGRSSWLAANRRANDIGGTLAVVETQIENDFISSRLIRREAYIGLSDRKKEGTFVWVNGAMPIFKSWGNNQPNADGDFVHMNSQGDWFDSDGSELLEYVVEIKGCDHVDQIGGPASGSTFRTGTTTITYVAADGCGGRDTCSFDIKITTGASDDISEGRSGNKEDLIQSQVAFDIYPNPATSFLYVDFKSDIMKIQEISVYQSNGQLTQRYNPNQTSQSGIDVSAMTSGLYFLRVTDVQGNIATKKFAIE